MNDLSPAGSPPPEESGRRNIEPGLQVGGAAPRPVTGATASTPSWVIPMIILALVAGLGIGLAVGLLVGGNDGSGEAATTTTTAAWTPEDAYGEAVRVTGNALPMLSMTGEPDTAVGRPLPEITGTDYAGNSRTIAADGRPKLIVALAHWCPYCNQELPVLSGWYAAGGPGEVEVVSLSVFVNPTRDHFPPARWLVENSWALPLIADDQSGTLAATLGIPAVPFWLLVSADGTVLQRTTGYREAAVIDGFVADLAATPDS